jgi:predicted PurR-regulated permease PerM
MTRSGPDPFLRRAVLVVALAAGAAAVGVLAVRGVYVLLAAFAGVLLAVVLNAGARFVSRRTPLGYGVSLAAVVLAITMVLAGAGWLLGGQVADQAAEFSEMLPEVAAEVRQYLEQQGWGQWLLEQVDGGTGGEGEEGDAGGEGGPTASGGQVLAVLAALSNLFTYILVALFVGLFGAANPKLYTDGILALTPPRQRDAMADVLDALGHTLRRWMLGQGMAMVLIGVSTMIVLSLFGVPLAIVVGLLVGLLGFIPYLGPIIGVVPVAIVAAPEGAAILLWVLLAYTAVQMVEGYGITPLIFERTVYLPPVFTIITQILLGAALGIMGIVLATPIAAVLLVLSRAYRRYVLGDDVPLRSTKSE